MGDISSSVMADSSSVTPKLVCGLDLGDKKSHVCMRTPEGEILERAKIDTTEPGLARYFQNRAPMRIALETGTHSPWASRLLRRWGHEVLVANPRKVRLIGNSRRKNDRLDALSLADLASVRPRLLYPIEHVTAQAQADRGVLRSRDALVRARASLILHTRGLVKAQGGRLPSCSADSFADHSPQGECLQPARHVRYHAEPGAGLQLRVHAGRAIAGGTLRYHSTPTTLMLPPNATTALWQRASGAWELAAPTAPPPETTALGPLWFATTDAAGVTELLDRRTFAADSVVIHLRGGLPAAPGPIAKALVVHDGLILEDVLYHLSDSGGGSAGQTQLDLLLNSATPYPSAAQDDHCPAWPFDAADLIVQGRIHELAELHSGQLLQLVSIEHPTGGTPARAEAYLLCRRP